MHCDFKTKIFCINCSFREVGIKNTEQIARLFPIATDKIVFQLAEETLGKVIFKIRYKVRPNHL